MEGRSVGYILAEALTAGSPGTTGPGCVKEVRFGGEIHPF